MFKKTQKYLLINYPLFWNSKIVPLVGFLIPVHIIFFVIGYVSGKLDFSETNNHYHSRDTDTMVFFSILIAIITLILWLVFYFKNNGFKSFYPKSNWDIFKEWLMVLVVAILLCSIHLSYLKGYDTRIRSYYPEKEAMKRCETISRASMFYGENYEAAANHDTLIKDTMRVERMNYVVFKKKNYPLESLINKGVENFTFFDAAWDSVTKVKLKTWLINDQKDSVRAVMKNYFKLIREHKLDSNIDEGKWFSVVYTPPSFKQTRIIAKKQMVFYNDRTGKYNTYEENYNGESQDYYDTINQYIKTINKQKYAFNKTYIAAEELEYNYQKIATAYVYPSVSSNAALISLYFAFALSILLFSFRITSGRNWLIALIAMGIFNILLGIFSAIFSKEVFYVSGLLALFFAAVIYFTIILIRKTKKGISGIVLNALLWMLPAFIPCAYFLTETILREVYYKYNYHPNVYPLEYESPYVQWMNDNAQGMGWCNLLFVLLVMLFLSFKIKKWRGIAEG